MKILYQLPAFFVTLVISSIVGLNFAAETRPVENGRELLVLRNGRILEGRIAKLEDHYLVDLPDGEINVRSAEVDFICRNLEEGYQRKRSVTQIGDWRGHLDLARWCFKHEMRDHAVAELAAAEAISPNNPMLGALRRQMEPVADPPAKSEKTPTPEDSVSNQELDRMVRGLPPRTMESFTQTVQPMLMNSCTMAGCHGPQSATNLKLFRVSAGEGTYRRLTQRNLYTVLQYVDRENPAQSPLLTLPAAPHGTAKKAIYTNRQPGQYLRIAQWVMALGTNDRSAPPEMPVNGESPQNLSNMSPSELETPPRLLSREAQRAKPLPAAGKSRRQPLSGADSGEREVEPASYQEPPAEFLQSNFSRPGSAIHSAKTVSPPVSSLGLPPMQKVQHGAPLPREGSKDPFDPEIFNRRYHKAESPPEGGNPAPGSLPPEKTPAGG